MNKTFFFFFDNIKDELDDMCIGEDCRIIVGGDFNLIMDPKLMAMGATQN